MKKILAGLFTKFRTLAESLQDLPPLMMRLALAYGFYEPAMQKVKNFASVTEWFEGLGIPYPVLNTYLAVGTEVSGIILLTLGLATRLISVPLIVVMLVAIGTVHLENGFACAKNGFEIPFYYMLMLFTLFCYGPGRLSLDYCVKKTFGK